MLALISMFILGWAAGGAFMILRRLTPVLRAGDRRALITGIGLMAAAAGLQLYVHGVL